MTKTASEWHKSIPSRRIRLGCISREHMRMIWTKRSVPRACKEVRCATQDTTEESAGSQSRRHALLSLVSWAAPATIAREANAAAEINYDRQF
ncbi:hypothetical protein CYMTET_45952 [Cymbomonas tetramitiformis]|uniref:Uncharacterized protein n=1 Tax=Cymbomonas tetramitiformis TaxID=36881 RepID=A0AAE0EXI7_9CHLO|nr:hypothetical protein CYMTET_45952 [Cymbomonas tetramitiformis]